MSHVVTKQEEELQTLKKFIENSGKEFDLSLVDYSHSEPCDVAYKGVQLRIIHFLKEKILIKNTYSTIKNFVAHGKIYFWYFEVRIFNYEYSDPPASKS